MTCYAASNARSCCIWFANTYTVFLSQESKSNGDIAGCMERDQKHADCLWCRLTTSWAVPLWTALHTTSCVCPAARGRHHYTRMDCTPNLTSRTKVAAGFPVGLFHRKTCSCNFTLLSRLQVLLNLRTHMIYTLSHLSPVNEMEFRCVLKKNFLASVRMV